MCVLFYCNLCVCWYDVFSASFVEGDVEGSFRYLFFDISVFMDEIRFVCSVTVVLMDHPLPLR